MNKEIFRELANKATEYCIETYKDDPKTQAWLWKDKFAEFIYKDIIKVVAAQALQGESALDVFTHLTLLYEGVNLRAAQDKLESPISLDF